MGKSVEQLGELIQRLVENGIIVGDPNLTVDDYTHLVFSARDYLLYQRKATGMELTNSHVMNEPKDYKILAGKVVLEKGFCVQGIDGVVLLDAGENELPDLIMPMSPSGISLIANSIFCYYLPNTTYISFKNIPSGAKKLRIYTIAGSSPDDIVSEDLAWMIIQQIFKLGQLAKATKADTSADGNNTDDGLKEQIRQLMNTQNNVD